MSTVSQRFADVAAAHGYRGADTATMVAAAAAFDIDLEQAADWLDADITPWGSRAWRAEGFADGAEAAPYRARGLTPAGGYLARRDERARSRHRS